MVTGKHKPPIVPKLKTHDHTVDRAPTHEHAPRALVVQDTVPICLCFDRHRRAAATRGDGQGGRLGQRAGPSADKPKSRENGANMHKGTEVKHTLG